MNADYRSLDIVQQWVANMDRRAYGLLIGLLIGALGGLVGLVIALAGPVLAFGLVLGIVVGLYVLTDVNAALYGIIGIMLLLPYGTFPYKIGLTPTLMDMAIGGFLLVYLMRWMTGRQRDLKFTPVHLLLAFYILWLILSFALGLRWAWFTPAIARQFVETLLALAMVFIIVDMLREPKQIRRLVLVLLLAITTEAAITLFLYALPDQTADLTLARLARIGYPPGGVIRYIEENPELAERAIGTWNDPNSLGGVLAISAVIIAPQVFAQRPVMRYRWLTFVALAVVGLALFLTYSRTSMAAFAAGLGVIAVVRYRRFIPLMLLALIAVLLLPQTQAYVQRFAQAITFSDLASQMRVGEYTDALRLIRRYPITGVGFTGTPDIDIYTDVASLYLIMANQIGLVGLGIFLTFIGGVFVYGIRAHRFARHNVALGAIHLGYHAALLTAMINAVGDLFFFRIDFQASITMFWLTVTVALASSRLTIESGQASQFEE